MTPQENIYRSDEDVVDGLDIRDMMEDDQYEHAFYDDVDGIVDVEQFAEDFTNDSIDTLRGMMEDDQYDIYDADDDGQPTLQEEYHDLYDGDDYIGDMFLDVVDYPEDWG